MVTKRRVTTFTLAYGIGGENSAMSFLMMMSCAACRAPATSGETGSQ